MARQYFITACILSVCIDLVNNAAFEKILKDEKIGLYSTKDSLEILSVHNLNDQLYGQKHAWLIEFYNSWCGFCQRFAPGWKEFAADVKPWQDLVKIGVIDCSNEENSPTCRKFEIMGYPTLKYFHQNYQEGPTNLGYHIDKAGSDATQHRHKLIEMLIEEKTQHKSETIPDLNPITAQTIEEIWAGKSATAQHVMLVVQAPGSFLGQELILDLHKIQQLQIFFTFSNNSITSSFGALTYPKILVIKPDGFNVLPINPVNRQNGRKAIKAYLKSKGVPIEEDVDNLSWKVVEEEPQDVEVEAIIRKIKEAGDAVYQGDLETALRYSLKHEISSKKIIEGEALDALKAYLLVLDKYFPFGRNGKEFLQSLRNMVESADSIEGLEIWKKINEAEQDRSQVFSSPNTWLACRGSSPVHRGYPCGLWKLFHYLTVNAAIRADLQDPNQVLKAMHGYIKNYFGCTDCSQHFQEMAERRGIFKVDSAESAIIWLWKAHNEVNHRLAGDKTEDPEFKKIQFPSKANCHKCHFDDDTWDVPQVLAYLKEMYSSINIRYIGSDQRIIHMGLGAEESNLGSAGVFKTIDTSMCVILYIASFALIIMLIRMFLKRGYRKKQYVHDLLGKV